MAEGIGSHGKGTCGSGGCWVLGCGCLAWNTSIPSLRGVAGSHGRALSPQSWMLVQRKWMYLESIFIGGDIRSQLPDEAKKFDNIDRVFRRASGRGHCRPEDRKGGREGGFLFLCSPSAPGVCTVSRMKGISLIL